MGIKKKCREINQAKNKFVKWLKDNKAEDIDIYEGEDFCNEWDYYRSISAFIGDNLYIVRFTAWNDKVKIDYSDEENKYRNMTIDEFYQLLNLND